jgi:hypothetical protein
MSTPRTSKNPQPGDKDYHLDFDEFQAEGVAAPLTCGACGQPITNTQYWIGQKGKFRHFSTSECGVAAPLEPTLEENNHWKWFREMGLQHCNSREAHWHEKDQSLCKSCHYAKTVAEAYAAAVSKNSKKNWPRCEHDGISR